MPNPSGAKKLSKLFDSVNSYLFENTSISCRWASTMVQKVDQHFERVPGEEKRTNTANSVNLNAKNIIRFS